MNKIQAIIFALVLTWLSCTHDTKKATIIKPIDSVAINSERLLGAWQHCKTTYHDGGRDIETMAYVCPTVSFNKNHSLTLSFNRAPVTWKLLNKNHVSISKNALFNDSVYTITFKPQKGYLELIMKSMDNKTSYFLGREDK